MPKVATCDVVSDKDWTIGSPDNDDDFPLGVPEDMAVGCLPMRMIPFDLPQPPSNPVATRSHPRLPKTGSSSTSSTRKADAMAQRRIRASRLRSTIALSTATAVLTGLLVLAAPTPAAADTPVQGMGNYCSLNWPSGGWAFASDPAGGDPCAWLIGQSAPGYTISRKGLYASNGWNNVVVRCNSNQSWVGIYRGWGNGPLSAAFNSAVGENKQYCVFTASPMSLPVFNSPFSLAASYSHVTGFDFARPPYNTLDVSQFGQVGSAVASVVDWKGKDKSALGYIDNHAGNDWLMPKGTAIKAVAEGRVIAARSWLSTCAGSDSKYQKEVAIRHRIRGANGYSETFVTYYAHLSSFTVTVGQQVNAGTLLGYSGNTGCSTAPHLHFATLRETNTAANRFETLHFFNDNTHSDGGNFVIDAYGFDPPKGFDPWSWRGYPAGALSINLWKGGQAPSLGAW